MSASSNGAERWTVRPFPCLLAILYAAGIWYLSSRTFQGTGSSWSWKYSSNLLHYPLFGGLAVLLAETFRDAGTLSRRSRATVLLLVLAYGIIDELHQSRTPGRSVEMADVATDLLGGLGFLMLWWGYRGGGQRRPAHRRFLIVTALAAAGVLVRVS